MTAAGRIAVAGSGPNGLAAAVALAREGFDVTVHEAADAIGGGTRSEELTLPGFLHDVCSAVHPMALLSPFFRELDLAAHGLEWIHPPILMAHPFDDGTAAVLERGSVATGESLGGDGPAYRRMIDPLVERWREIVDGALGPPLRIPDHPFAMARLGLVGLRSAKNLVESRFDGERARAFLLGIAGHALLPMDMIPSAAFGVMLALAGHAAGWPIPRGGSRRIAGALAGLLAENGGRVVTGSPVRSLDPFDDHRAVVLDLTPRQVLPIAGDRLPRGYRRRLARYRYSPGVFKIDWALREPIPWRAKECAAAGTLHLGAGADEIVHSAAAAWRGSHDDPSPFVILTQPSLFDDSRAPAGSHVAWAYCHVPHGSRRDMSAAIEAQVERFAPGFRDVILARHTFDTAELETRNENLIGGDINGGVQDLWQFLFRPVPRLDPYATPDPRIFLCSAATPPGGAVHGMCGYHAARSVLRRLRDR